MSKDDGGPASEKTLRDEAEMRFIAACAKSLVTAANMATVMDEAPNDGMDKLATATVRVGMFLAKRWLAERARREQPDAGKENPGGD